MATNEGLFRNRSLLIIGFSEAVSNIGNWITMIAVFSMVVFKGAGGVTQSSAVFLAGLLPTLLFSPVAGWLVDRCDRKRLMIASELLSGLVIIGLIFITQVEFIFAILALQAVSMALMAPARQAAVPGLVERADLSRANALLQQLNGLIKMIAPVVAGLILAVMNPHQAVILDVISFGLSALILNNLPALPPQSESAAWQGSSVPPAKSKPEQVLPVLRRSAGLKLLFSAAFLAISVFVGFDILAPVYTRDVLAGGESLFGLEVGLIGVGTLLATGFLVLRKGRSAPWHELAGGLMLLAFIPFSMAVALRLDSVAAGRMLVLAGCLVGGNGNGLTLVQAGTLLQLCSPSSLLGRLGGLFQSVIVAGQLAGILVTPLLVPVLVPMGVYFLAAAVCALLLAGSILIAQPRTAVPLASSSYGD